jgi:hypothetical protein
VLLQLATRHRCVAALDGVALLGLVCADCQHPDVTSRWSVSRLTRSSADTVRDCSTGFKRTVNSLAGSLLATCRGTITFICSWHVSPWSL